METQTFTTFEVAKFCKVSHRTIRQWIADGKLRSFRTVGNHSRVTLSDLRGFLEEHDMPIPQILRTNKRKRILIVDDDKSLVSILKEIFSRNGEFDIETAYDGFEAGKKFAHFKPDLVTLDIRMPKMDGFEVLKQIRSDADNGFTKIIVISAFSEEGEKRMSIKLGADAFFDKPFVYGDLLKRVFELLEVNNYESK
ncbi:MAG: response regulator [Candidatus Omnitrophica bacterium]|nr:response regulator [Candidatus Omnitrophota bacterium]